jgi:HEPN/Toprim N-terminal domain 1
MYRYVHMGTWTELTVSGFDLIGSKSAIIPEVMTIFRESDRKETLVPAAPGDVANAEPEEGPELKIVYVTTVRNAIARLEVMGFTRKRVAGEFEAQRKQWVEYCEQSVAEGEDVYADKLEILSALTYDTYAAAFGEIVRSGLRAYPFDDLDQPGLEPLKKYILDQHDDEPFGFFMTDWRALIRMACDAVDADAVVEQDISALVDGGYYDRDEPVCTTSIAALVAAHPENAPRIILTEGPSDSRILGAALRLLYPHLADYYTFLDFEGTRAAGGASAVITSIKAFAAAGITNRMIALLDNDTAAREARRALRQIQLPVNIAVHHYPPLDALRSYPTLGPTGLAVLDVNGLAASIELYVGRDCLVDAAGQLRPVHWRGYNEALGEYHGEVTAKDQIQSAFFQKIQAATNNPAALAAGDWEGLHLILQSVFHAFDEVVPPPARDSFWEY